MENRFVVIINRQNLIAASCILICTISSSGLASNQKNNTSSDDVVSSKNIRFYWANKHQQRIRSNTLKSKTTVAGCHNFRRSKRIITIIQVGFESCSVYTKKDCDSESIVKANHSKQDAYSKQLTEGHGWLPKPQSEKDRKGVRLRSWSCQ